MHTSLQNDKDELAKTLLAEKTQLERAYPFKQKYDPF